MRVSRSSDGYATLQQSTSLCVTHGVVLSTRRQLASVLYYSRGSQSRTMCLRRGCRGEWKRVKENSGARHYEPNGKARKSKTSHLEPFEDRKVITQKVMPSELLEEYHSAHCRSTSMDAQPSSRPKINFSQQSSIIRGLIEQFTVMEKTQVCESEGVGLCISVLGEGELVASATCARA